MSSFGADARVNDITQDSKGNLYFANTHSVYLYNGTRWQVIPSTINIKPRSLAASSDGKVYVGCTGDFGYLAVNAQGIVTFYSLKPVTSDKTVDTEVYKETFVRPEGVYFSAKSRIYWWDGQVLKALRPPKSTFHRSTVIGDSLIVQLRRVGLSKLKNGQLTPFVSGDFFADKTIYALLPFDDELLLVTPTKGMYRYGQNKFTRWVVGSAVKALLTNSRIYRAQWLANGQLALSLLGDNKGLLILTKNGDLVRFLTVNEGLSDESIIALHQDSQNGLWLAMRNGLDRIEVASPLTFFDKQDQLEGYVYSVIRHQGYFYAATSDGIYRLDKQEDKLRFQRAQGADDVCFKLLKTSKGLLAACHSNLFLIDNLQVTSLASQSKYHFVRLHVSSDSNEQLQVLVPNSVGLGLLSNQDNKWQYRQLAEQEINFPVRYVAQDETGNLWINSQFEGIIRAKFPNGFDSKPAIDYFDISHGLPKGGIFPSRIDNKVVFNTDSGLYRFDDVQNKFVGETRFGDLSRKNLYLSESSGNVVSMLETLPRQGDSASIGGSRLAVAEKQGEQYNLNYQDYRRVSTYPATSIYTEADGVSWIKSGNKLLRFDRKLHQRDGKILPPSISKISPLGSDEQLLRGGDDKSLVFDYQNNSLRFEFAFAAFDVSDKNRFQYRLSGFDDKWSDWSQESHKDYTRIYEGKYSFELRAKNVYGEIASAKGVAFTVLAPWYRSFWAYLSYAMLLVFIILLVMRIRTQALTLRAEKLEGIIEQRTKTIREGALVIEQQKASIEDLLEQKNDLFANISHEFRTPLTLILGPTNNLLQSKVDSSQKGHLQLIRQSGFKLLRMVNQILTLAKLSSIPHQERVLLSLKEHVDFMMASFAPLAQEKQLNFTVSKYDEVKLYMVSDSLEKILLNLLSNAIKYTASKGKVSLVIEAFKPHWVSISVSDSGYGIPDEQLGLVFERFKRINHPEHVKIQGTGLGLSMVKELVEAHGGVIDLQTELGKGSTFRVELPVEQNVDSVTSSAGLAAAKSSVDLELKTLEKPQDTAPVVVEEHPEQSLQSSVAIQNSTKTSLLIIEDTPEMRDFLVSLFVEQYEVFSAPDGEQGIEVAKKQLPDIIISDLMMPGKNGYEVCNELKTHELTSHIPIILLTAKADLESRMQGWAEQADEYLAKPFDEGELKIRVTNLLGIRQTLKQRFGRILHEQPEALPELITELNDKDQQFLERFQTLIEKRHADSDLNLPTAAKELFVSERLLQKKLKALLDHNFTEFLRTFRLNRAAQMLKEGKRASDVADETGFSSQAYFSRCFKAEFGKTATQYQQGA